jgi:hypothetical protein
MKKPTKSQDLIRKLQTSPTLTRNRLEMDQQSPPSSINYSPKKDNLTSNSNQNINSLRMSMRSSKSKSKATDV